MNQSILKNLLSGFPDKIEKAQAEMRSQSFEGSAGGDWVKVVINGEGSIQSLKIHPSCVNSEEVKVLEDLIKSAINQAQEKQKDWLKQRSLAFFG